MLEQATEHDTPLPDVGKVDLALAPLGPVGRILKSFGSRLATLVWFLWGEVTGDRRFIL
jgi:hypothetical protein